MTKKKAQLLAAIAAMVVVAACLFGCGPTQTTAVVTLPGNASTGYTWDYAMDKTGVLQETSNSYSAEASGAEGSQTYEFKAVADGTVTIDFKYVSETDKNKASDISATYVYNVKGGNVTLVSKTEHIAK